jgi:hypothetical protein
MLIYGTYAGAGGAPDFRTTGNGGSIQNTATVNSVTVPTDLVFASDSGLTSLLKWEIVAYTASTGVIIAWIKIPTLSASSDTVIYLGYGDAAITTWQGDINGTWNSSFLFMLHGSNSINDATSNGRNFTTGSSSYTTCKFGTGVRLNGGGLTVLSCSDSGLPTGTNSRTIKMWIAWTGTVSGGSFAYGNQGTSEQDIRWRHDSGVFKFLASSDDITYTFTPTTNQFYHIVCTYNSSGTVGKIYVNGSNVTTTTKASWNTVLGGTVTFGGDAFSQCNTDNQEMAMRNVVESADEVLAEYNNQNSPSTFYTFSVSGGGGGSGLLYGQLDLSGIGGAGRFAKLIN